MPRLTKKAPKAAKNKRTREEMHKFKRGTLRSSGGKKVKNRKQAVAIAMSESGQSNRKNKPKPKPSAKDSQGRNVASTTKPKRKAAMRKSRNKGRT